MAKKKSTVTAKKQNLQGLKLAKIIAGFATDKKAKDIVVLDMRKVANFCDYFVICSGTSDRQVKAIAQGIDDGLHEKGIKVRKKQGLKTNKTQNLPVWVLLDFGDIVVHIFDDNSRKFYELEHLWQEATLIDINCK